MPSNGVKSSNFDQNICIQGVLGHFWPVGWIGILGKNKPTVWQWVYS